MKLLLSPHNDDETLFAAYTILREKPFVIIVTDSYIQEERGDKITWDQRRRETEQALTMLGSEAHFLGIPDTDLNHFELHEILKVYDAEVIYAPAIQGGHRQHDMVGEVARELWGKKVKYYATYTKTDLTPKGDVEIKPTEIEKQMKNDALDCYTSQIRINKLHFDAVRDKSEWFVNY